MTKVKRTERGWGGHYIGATKCLFRLNTLLEYKEKKVVISTVGMYMPDGKPEIIGWKRFYETMAFAGKQENEYIEADVSEKIEFESQSEIEEPYKDNEANSMHENIVQELTTKIKQND